MLARITAREIEKVNEFEKKWKIKTNQIKFQIIQIARTKPAEIRVGNTRYEHQTEGKALGLTMTRNGFAKHVQQKIEMAKSKPSHLYRFNELLHSNKR